MPFVLDTSVTIAWCFEDEANLYTEAIFDRLRSTPAVTPAIWPLEVANTLLVGERRRRVTTEQVARFIQTLAALPITVENTAFDEALGPVVELGRRQGLSAYDASYLNLAMREGLPIATQDARLRTAASRVGVALVQ